MFKKYGKLEVDVKCDGISLAKFEGDLEQCEKKWKNTIRRKMG